LKRTKHFIFCGGIPPPDLPKNSAVVSLNRFGSKPNVFLKIKDISKPLGKEISDTYLDLLDIAVYVYCADQMINRGRNVIRPNDKRWHRELNFFIPVRRPDFWADPETNKLLCNALNFLSDDHFSFKFLKSTDHIPVELYFDFGDFDYADEVILFSGGLDSLAGAVKEAILDKKQVALVSHRPLPLINTRQEKLFKQLRNRCDQGRPFYLPIWAHKVEEDSKENTQRTRAFLYASLAVSVADLIGLSRIRFYENGITSINLALMKQLIGARASRTTHPKVIHRFQQFFSRITGKTFEVENHFFWKTKAEIVNFIGDAGFADLIKYSVSCSKTRYSSAANPHCCQCSQCIERRFATLASNYGEYDLDELYEKDLFTSSRTALFDRMMATGYVNAYQEIEEMNENDLFDNHGELNRLTRYFDEPVDVTAEKIYNLIKRQAEQVGGVLDRTISENSERMRKKRLHKSSLIMLTLAEPADQESTVDEAETVKPVILPTFRLIGEKWQLAFDDETVYMNDRIGIRYIAYLLARPDGEIPAILLYQAVNLKGPPSRDIEEKWQIKDSFYTEALENRDSENPIPLSDEKAIKAYRAKLSELYEELQDAERYFSDEEKTRIQGEIDKIEQHLGKVLGLGGMARKADDESEKIRKSVTNAINRARQKILEEHYILGRHLEKYIKTGSFNSYHPDHPVDWQL